MLVYFDDGGSGMRMRDEPFEVGCEPGRRRRPLPGRSTDDARTRERRRDRPTPWPKRALTAERPLRAFRWSTNVKGTEARLDGTVRGATPALPDPSGASSV